MKEQLTQERINKLNERQNSGQFHPLTCLNDGDKEHIEYEYAKRLISLPYEDYIKQEKERGIPFPHMAFTETILIATKDGWICPVCDYKQPINF